MDGDRFDALLRAFSKPPTRRDALRLLTGSALGSLLGLEQLKMKAKKGKGKGHGKGKGKGKGGNKKCKNKGKTTICLKGETISVSNCSLKARCCRSPAPRLAHSPPSPPFRRW